MTPRLADVAHKRGLDATSNLGRGELGARDEVLYPRVAAEERTFVTNNESDFLGIVAEEELHAGLIVMPQGLRDEQCANFGRILDYIYERALADGEDEGIWMTNRVVEMSEGNGIQHYWLPAAE